MSDKIRLGSHEESHGAPHACQAPGQIAYVSDSGSEAQIYVVNSDDSGVSPVTAQPGSKADPAWSRDGSRIAFTSTGDGNREIYVMSGNWTNAARLTNAAPWTIGLRGRPTARGSRSSAIATATPRSTS